MPERAAHEPLLSELASEEGALAEEMADSLPPPPPSCVPELGLTPASTAVGKETRLALLVPPNTLPGYELQEEIGRGAMGAIYRAWQPALQRTVALKVILAGNLASAEQRARFRIEAQAIARLQHPNIVQIFDVGEHQGLAYLVLEYVDGGNLATQLNGQPLPQPDAAHIAETLARAIHYAHEQGIVHRDLKPANILLQPISHRCTQINTDEREENNRYSMCVDLCSSVAKITDFGLAKRLDVAGGYTQTDAVLGTPPYMSPEQAAGKEVGPASDIYTLGAILYEMLTGRCPFRARTSDETRRLVRECEPVRPRKYVPHVDPVLEAICLKCMEKEPVRRYATAAALADDLGRWQRAEPVAISPETWLRRAARKIRRRPRAAVLVALLIALTCGLFVAAYMRDPARIREQWERNLAKGEPVTIVGAQGTPRWYRKVTQGTQADVAPELDGAFSVQSSNVGLVEFISDPQHSHYQIAADLRHDKRSENEASGGFRSTVSLFFGLTQRSNDDGVQFCFCKVAFNDLTAPTERAWQPNAVGNPVWLCVQAYQEPKRHTTDFAQIGVPSRGHAPIVFSPYGFAAKDHYRHLVVEVSPRRVRVEWENQQSFEIPVPWIEKTMHANGGPANPYSFNPRGGLGIGVQSGIVSVRHFKVTPLANED